MRENTVRTRLSEGKPVFGVISPTIDPIIVEYIGLVGFDFYMLDGEHGALSPAHAEHMVRAAESIDITPLARVRSLDEKLILQFLDTGIMGIMMPGCTTADDCAALVRAVKYPPVGERGIGPVRAARYMLGGMSQQEYIRHANNQTLVLPQIEDITALDHLEEMCHVEGVDGFIIGPRDLAVTMGFYDSPSHEEVRKVIDQIIEIVVRHNRIVGTVAATKEQAHALVDKGVRMILHSVAGLISQSAKAFLS
ncbi:MAG: aldolase/citrate lyase family protein [Bacteroidota bacterium]|nr:aldolase/citrate lyase family protein [Candidatus Kapabacteria bacterium]MDW8219214.1 aldolase/citrate lyase family protein [Bacteroidota bacterium]